MKKTLLLATGALVAAGFASTDAKAVDVELYGQVNKVVTLADNGGTGNNNELNVTDNEKSSSRIGFKGEQALDNGLTASVLLEVEIDGGDSSDGAGLNSGHQNSQSGDNISVRHSRVGLAGDFGAVFVGHTSAATDGIAEIDMAGVNNLMGSAVDEIGGGIVAVAATGTSSSILKDDNGSYTASIGAAFNNFDGGREDAIAYHTPVVAGFQGQVAYHESETVSAAVRYSGKFDAFAVKAGLGYTMADTDTAGNNLESNTLAGSVSVKHDSGLAGTLSYGKQDDAADTKDREDSQLYVKVGYAWDAFEVAADYATFEAEGVATNANNDATEVEGTSYGLGGQYNLGHGVSVAAGYRTFEVEDNTTNTYEDVDVFMANLRVKF